MRGCKVVFAPRVGLGTSEMTRAKLAVVLDLARWLALSVQCPDVLAVERRNKQARGDEVQLSHVRLDLPQRSVAQRQDIVLSHLLFFSCFFSNFL